MRGERLESRFVLPSAGSRPKAGPPERAGKDYWKPTLRFELAEFQFRFIVKTPALSPLLPLLPRSSTASPLLSANGPPESAVRSAQRRDAYALLNVWACFSENAYAVRASVSASSMKRWYDRQIFRPAHTLPSDVTRYPTKRIPADTGWKETFFGWRTSPSSLSLAENPVRISFSRSDVPSMTKSSMYRTKRTLSACLRYWSTSFR